jgi:hypothetical protein
MSMISAPFQMLANTIGGDGDVVVKTGNSPDGGGTVALPGG